MVLGDAILHQRTIDPRSRELICLAVTAVFEVPYIRYAHERIGMTVGLSQEQVSSAVKGIVPKDLVESDTVIYKTALKLAQSRGSLDNEIWREAEVKLGKERAARVGHIVAWFIYNCTLLNLGAVDVPLD